MTIHQPEPPDAEPEQSADQPSPTPVPSVQSSQEFYAEITKRPDVRAILEALAKE